MNFRDDRKQVFCDSFGSQSSNATSIHSVLNMCMTVPNIVRNMKILPTYGQCIPSHTEIILKLSQSAVCITGITKMPDIHNTCRGPQSLGLSSGSYNMGVYPLRVSFLNMKF